MPDRPYTLLSCAVSIDGYLDDASPDRLILSGPEDLDEVDELRAAADAILVGAGTIRADNPRLLVRDPARSAGREADGRAPHPLRVTLTATGDLDPAARFFTGPGTPLVYCATAATAVLRKSLGDRAAVIDMGAELSLSAVLNHLYAERTVATVLIEGGAHILRQALAGDLADELRLAIAPFFVSDQDAPRFARPAPYPHTPADPMILTDLRRLGQVAVHHYRLTPRFRPSSLPEPRPSPLSRPRRRPSPLSPSRHSSPSSARGVTPALPPPEASPQPFLRPRRRPSPSSARGVAPALPPPDLSR